MEKAVDWGREYLAKYGALPGRLEVAKHFGPITDHQARKIAKEIRKTLLVPAGDGFSTLPDDAEDGEALWETHAALSRRAIRNRDFTTHRTVDMDGTAPIMICFPSDMHIGAALTDHDRILSDQKLIVSTPRCYQILPGDVIDNAIKHKGMMVNSDATPTKEARMAAYLLRLGGQRILGVVGGNHDGWTSETAGIDLLRLLCGHSGVIYSPHRMHLTLHLGEQEYRILSAHRYRFHSSLNPLHACQRLLERGQDDADVIAVGHHHEVATGTFYHRRTRRIAIRSGSYQISSAFADDHGFDDCPPVCPCVILWGDSFRFEVFDDFRRGLDFFLALQPPALATTA